MASIEIPLEPVPASRPRVSKWGAYYTGKYPVWMKQARAYVRKGHLDLPDDAELLVVVEHICAKPKTSKRYYPKGDCDNFVKGPLDVVTKAEGWWYDDDQLTYLLTCKRFAKRGETPRTVMEIYRP